MSRIYEVVIRVEMSDESCVDEAETWAVIPMI